VLAPAAFAQGADAWPSKPIRIVSRLNAEINKILSTPEMKELTVKLNVEPPAARSTAQFRELLVRDLVAWKKIVTDAKVKVED